MQGADEIAVGAFEDAAALVAAADGVRAIYHICPNVSPHEIAYARALIAAAKAAGVPRFVYHSVLHPQIEAMPHHWAKLRVEEMLLASGLAVTVLQPTAYMQNLLAGWRSIVEDGVYRVPYPVATRISLVDLRDVAEAAALVLTEDGHVGATYALVGTPALTQTEVAETLSLAIAAAGARGRRNRRNVGSPCRRRNGRLSAPDLGRHVPQLRRPRSRRQRQRSQLAPRG